MIKYIQDILGITALKYTNKRLKEQLQQVDDDLLKLVNLLEVYQQVYGTRIKASMIASNAITADQIKAGSIVVTEPVND